MEVSIYKWKCCHNVKSNFWSSFHQQSTCTDIKQEGTKAEHFCTIRHIVIFVFFPTVYELVELNASSR